MSSVREQVLTWKETVQLQQPPKKSSSFGVLGFYSIQSIHVGFHSKLGGVFKHFSFSPLKLGKWSILTSIFFKWLETTNKLRSFPVWRCTIKMKFVDLHFFPKQNANKTWNHANDVCFPFKKKTVFSIQNHSCHIAKTQGDSLKPQKETLLQQCGFNVDDRRFMPLG